MPSFTKKQQIAILVLGIVLILILRNKFNLGSEVDSDSQFKEIEFSQELDSSEEKYEQDSEIEENSSSELVVHIKGAVKYPGILVVKEGMRVADIVELAGGPDQGADFDRVNLAKKVQDEEMVHIPYIGEASTQSEKGEGVSAVETTSSGVALDESTGSKININTASKEELKTLSGIGEVTSEKIIDYREEHPFGSIEDIMDVSGIGEKKFEAIKDSIVAN